MVKVDLSAYRGKRDFARTPEPTGQTVGIQEGRFVIHKHSATADHYDLRLELGGVLKSWAIPKGPSLNPKDKRFAAETEDHPLEYLAFEGVIPEGAYGGGPIIVWDRGTWAPMGDVDEAFRTGDFKFRLWGEKLKGGWMLVRLKPKPGEEANGWLFFKERDQFADTKTDILATRPESVKSGRRIEDLRPAPKARRKAISPAKVSGVLKSAVPADVAPQLATAAAEPPSGEGWLHEIKFDGYRTIARVADGAVSGYIIACLYAPNGNPQPGPKFDYKLSWHERFARHAHTLLESGLPVVLAGDFNIVPAPADIYETKSYDDNALLQPAARAAFRELLEQGWTDAVRATHPDETIYTFWDYRRKRWERNAGLRLDHLLVSPSLAPSVHTASVDRDVRDEAGASDHAPVWVLLRR